MSEGFTEEQKERLSNLKPLTKTAMDMFGALLFSNHLQVTYDEVLKTYEPFKKVMKNDKFKKFVDSAWKKLDKDGDGKVTVDEFLTKS